MNRNEHDQYGNGQPAPFRLSRALRAGAVIAAVVAAGIWINPQHLRAGDDNVDTILQVRLGFQITPVPLNLKGRNPSLVGLGSYIVNALGGCNDCHSSGPAAQFAPGGNPFFGQHPSRPNSEAYLGGGRNFGPLVPNSPDIVSRNLTPDKSGRPIGGNSLSQFFQTMRSGADPDHVHPTCSATSGVPCLPPPFDGDLLQIMPWPAYRNMTNADLLAIYEYLSAIPCLEGGPGEPAHRCS